MLRLAIIASVVATAWPLAAGEHAPEPGWTYRVVDVAADDVLNVREQPGTAAPIVATLPPDDTGLSVTGARNAEHDDTFGPGTWWEILHEEAPGGAGWVNARFLAPDDPEAEPETGFALRCAGTEPFWSLDVADGVARFSAPEPEEAHPTWRAGGWQDAAGFRPGYRFAIRLDSAAQPGAGWAFVARTAEPMCTDHMSPFDYSYEIMLIKPANRVLAGCCTRAPGKPEE